MTRHFLSVRRFAAAAFVIALLALSAASAFADAGDPPATDPVGIIVIGG